MTTNYTNPLTVVSPKWAKIKIDEVILDTGDGGFSVVRLCYEEQVRLGIRWNGSNDHLGMPSSRGNPTWFIMPDEFMEVMASKSRELVTDKVKKVAGFIRKEVNDDRESTNNYTVSVALNIELNETEKNELKTILEKERIYFPSLDMCGKLSAIDGNYIYSVFYIN